MITESTYCTPSTTCWYGKGRASKKIEINLLTCMAWAELVFASCAFPEIVSDLCGACQIRLNDERKRKKSE